MGMDFIRKAAKSFNKSWDHHRIELCERNLFTQDVSSEPRTALAQSGRQLDAGSSVLVRLNGSEVVAYQELAPVATLLDPPKSILDLLREGGGSAVGTVVTHHDEGLVELAIC